MSDRPYIGVLESALEELQECYRSTAAYAVDALVYFASKGGDWHTIACDTETIRAQQWSALLILANLIRDVKEV